MTTKHTPGPWTVGKKNRIQAGNVVLIGEREITARSNNHLDLAKDEQDANAALIAAAPELLAACRVASDSIISEIEGCVSEGCNDTSPCSFCKDANRAFNMLTAAITKATGATL